MRRRLLPLVLFVACSQTKAAAPPERVTVSIVGTNDLHGHLDSLAVFGGYVANLRRARARDGGGVVLLDAGDMFQGTLASNIGEGTAVVRAYNLLRYDAVAIGNHEFDFGPVGPTGAPRKPTDDPRGALKARAAEARFPFLAANIVDAATKAPPAWPNVRPTTMVTVAGIKVGIVGVTTIATPRTTLASNFAGLAVTALAPSIATAAAALRQQGAAVVIVTAHAGGGCRRFAPADALDTCEPNSEIFQVARALPAGAVDAIVAGHTHDGVAHRVAGIPIIEAYAHGRAFGRIDLAIDRARGAVVDATLFPPHGVRADQSYEGAPVVADQEVAKAVQPALVEVKAKEAESLGVEAIAAIPRAYKTESAFGNLVADLMRSAPPGGDVAITNGGGLRADLPKGPVLYGNLFEALPFDNTFATLTITGAQLATLIRNNLGRDAGILSISGVRALARCEKRSLVVSLTRENGRPVKPTERLTLVTSNFLATGGDEVMQEIAADARFDDSRIIRDAVADQLRARKTPLDPAQLYDPRRPRLTYPAPRPVRCSSPGPK